jgi:hypothetical protein
MFAGRLGVTKRLISQSVLRHPTNLHFLAESRGNNTQTVQSHFFLSLKRKIGKNNK